MKLINNEEKIVEIRRVEIKVPLPYYEFPEDLPFLDDQTWNPIIDLNEGRIIDWPENYPINIFLKACDSGDYYLLDENDKVVSSLERDYVPNKLLPGKYGDYLELSISPSGRILNWKKDASLEDFEF